MGKWIRGRRRGLAVLLVMAMCAGLLIQESGAAGKESSVSYGGDGAKAQPVLYDVTARVKGKEISYASAGEKRAESVLKDLGMSVSSVIRGVSSDPGVMEVTERGGNVCLVAKGVGSARVNVTINRNTEIPLDITIKKAVYMNPVRGSDSNNGQSASVDSEGTGPLKTLEKSIELLGNSGAVYMLGGAETVHGSEALEGMDGSITVRRYSSYDGALFSVSKDSTLSLSGINIRTGTDKENNVVQLTENATLIIGADVSVSRKAVVQMGNEANPIELNAVPPAGTVYTLAVDNAADQKVLVHTNQNKNVLKYFALSEKLAGQYYLALNGDGDIIMVGRINSSETGGGTGTGGGGTGTGGGGTGTGGGGTGTGGGGTGTGGGSTGDHRMDTVYLDGQNGKDYHSGATARSAVATYGKAVELCRENNIRKICICGTVSVEEDTVWDEEGITITARMDFSDSMIRVQGAAFTLKADMEVSGCCGIECAEGSGLFLDDAYPVRVQSGGTGIVLAQGAASYTFNKGIILVQGHSTGIRIRSGSLNMRDGAVVDVRSGTGISAEGGVFTLEGAKLLGGEGQVAVKAISAFTIANDIDTEKVLQGDIALQGIPVRLGRKTEHTYRLRLSDFEAGDVVVSGGRVTDEESEKLFVVTDGGAIVRDAETNNMVYQPGNTIYLHNAEGDDTRDGQTTKTAVKTLKTALERIKASEKLDTICLMDRVTVQEDITVGDTDTDASKDLKIRTCAAMDEMFLVTGGTLTLGKVRIIGKGRMNGTEYRVSAIRVNGENAAVRTTDNTEVSVDTSDGSCYEVVSENGMLDLYGGGIHQVVIRNGDQSNGQLRLHPETELTGGIRIQAETPYCVPLLADESLTGHEILPLTFDRAGGWTGHEILTLEGGSVAELASCFRIPTGMSLLPGEELVGEKPSSLYLKQDQNAVYWSTAGADTNDGHSRENPVRSFGKAWELASEVKHGYIIICGAIIVSEDEVWKGGPVTKDGCTWTPVCYQDRETDWLENKKPVIKVESGVNLTMDGVIIDGDGALLNRADNGSWLEFIRVAASGSFHLTGKTVIRGLVTDAVVAVERGAVCTMDGEAQITANRIVDGAPFVVQGKMDMGGKARITDNHPADTGVLSGACDSGGISVVGLGEVDIHDDAAIEGNESNSYYGGAGVIANGTVRVYDRAVIRNNRSGGPGGGITAEYDSRIYISGQAAIEGNTASGGSGGGIMARDDSEVYISGQAAVRKNTASGGSGGGIWGGNIVVAEEAEITGNKAGQGAGICSGNLTIKDNVRIEGNTADLCGGGVQTFGACILEGNVEIRENRVIGTTKTKSYYGHGAAVHCAAVPANQYNDARNGSLILRGGTIEGEIYIQDPFPDKNKKVKGGLYLQGSGCQVKDTIILACERETSENSIRVTGAMMDMGNTYKVKIHRTFASQGTVTDPGTVVVRPGGTMTDASQYIQYFSYDNDSAVLEKSEEMIALANVVYIDGRNGSDDNDGSSPAKAKKTIPEVLGADVNYKNIQYYICGKVTVDQPDVRIVGNEKAHITRYTGFPVQGTPYTAYGGDLIEVEEGASLQMEDVAVSGIRSEEEDFYESGSLIVCRGELKLSGNTTLTDNPGPFIWLASGKYVETTDHSVAVKQKKRIMVELEQPEPGALVVKGTVNNNNVDHFRLISAQEKEYRLEEEGDNLVLGKTQDVWLDPAEGDDTADGRTPEEPVKTLERAHAVLGKSGGTVYVMSVVCVDGMGKGIALKQDNIRYLAYTKGITMFSVSNGSWLTVNGITIDGEGKAAELIHVEKGGSLGAEGDTCLSGATEYAIDTAALIVLKDRPVVHGTVYLRETSYIRAENLRLNTGEPLHLLADNEPEAGGEPRPLLLNTMLPPEIIQYEKADFVLENRQTGTSDDTRGIYLVRRKQMQKVYVDGQKGEDTADGFTAEQSVRTLSKAYEILDREAGALSESGQEMPEGQIVIVGTINVNEKTILSEKYIREGDHVTELSNSGRIRILRYGKAEGSNVPDCMDTLFHVTSELTLEDIEIDGHSRRVETEGAVRGCSSLIKVAAEGSLVTKGQVMLTDNDTADGQGGAIMNHGRMKASGLVIANCQARDGASIYQDGICEIKENNRFGNREIYLTEGKVINLSGENNIGLCLCPEERNRRVRLARATNDEGTGESIILSLCLAKRDELVPYHLIAEDDCVYMIEDLLPSYIALSDKEAVSDGTCIPIDAAEVRGSTGQITYTYYTDKEMSMQTGTGEGEGKAAYEGGAPSEAGVYYVVAELEADEQYEGAVSDPAVLTLFSSNSVELTLRMDDWAYTGQKLVLRMVSDRGMTSQRELEELSGHGVYFATELDPGTYDLYQGASDAEMEDTGNDIIVTASDHYQAVLEYYTVSYDANTTDAALKGKVPQSQIYPAGTIVKADTTNAGGLARPGYALDGWALSANGEKTVSMIVSGEHHTFYACWKVELPTEEPTQESTQEPTEEPTEEPTQEPTEEPTQEPTQAPTEEPTQEPTEEPTQEPTEEPTQEPTLEPTEEPTQEPTLVPTEVPSPVPSQDPTSKPGAVPVPDGDDLSNMTEEEIKNRIDDAKDKNWVDTPTELVNYEIIHRKNDDDIEGSVYALLCARITKRTKNTEKLIWNKIPGADGYIIYGNKCGLKNRYKKIKTVQKTKKKYVRKKLKKGTYYKYIIVAYKLVNGKRRTITVSKTVHATTKGGKYGVAGAVRVNRRKVTLRAGRTFQIRAKEVRLDKKKRIRPHRKISYETDNKKIATVKKGGRIRARKKGKSNIYVYAQNGIYQKVRVIVK